MSSNNLEEFAWIYALNATGSVAHLADIFFPLMPLARDNKTI